MLTSDEVLNISYRLEGLLLTVQHAAENDTSSTPLHQRGIASSIELAAELAGQITDGIETAQYGKSPAS